MQVDSSPLSQGDTPISNPPRPRDRPSLVACIECRKKHLKCDAEVPQCRRCVTARSTCVYEPSRRVQRLRSRAASGNRQLVRNIRKPLQRINTILSLPTPPQYQVRHDVQPTQSPSPSAIPQVEEPLSNSTTPLHQHETRFMQHQQAPFMTLPLESRNHNSTPLDSPSTEQQRQLNEQSNSQTTAVHHGSAIQGLGHLDPMNIQTLQAEENRLQASIIRANPVEIFASDHGSVPMQITGESNLYSSFGLYNKQLVNLFYNNFHSAHPILVPLKFFSSFDYPDYLQLVVNFIGGHFSNAIPDKSFETALLERLRDGFQKDSSLVQARLLFSIALHARNEIRAAQGMLKQAVSLAIDLGMNKETFAVSRTPNDGIARESMRRTWWQLFITDSYFAALYRMEGFVVSTGYSDVRLPCEESEYSEGSPSYDAPSLAHFEARMFTNDERQFSSFAYLIEAVRILSRVISVAGTQDAHVDEIQAVDNAIAGWTHHLPSTKSDIVNAYGESDELLFQAHMIVQYASMFLHFPRSDLISTIPNSSIACAQNETVVPPTSPQLLHSIKAVEASKELANLAALRLPQYKHTPFIICGLLSCAIVQLSAASKHGIRCIEQHRDRVSLIIGVLKTLSKTWELSQAAHAELKQVAGDVLQIDARSGWQEKSAKHTDVDLQSAAIFDNSWLNTIDFEGMRALLQFDSDFMLEP